MSNPLKNWQLQYGNTLQVQVTTKASSNRLAIVERADQMPLVKVYVTCVPEGGKANAVVIKMIAKALGVPKSSLTIKHGSKSRDKTIVIDRGQ